jgi:hypothetical protein
MLVDLRIMQANDAFGAPAAHGSTALGWQRLVGGSLFGDQLVGQFRACSAPPAVPRSKRYLPLTIMVGTPVISYFLASSLAWTICP